MDVAVYDYFLESTWVFVDGNVAVYEGNARVAYKCFLDSTWVSLGVDILQVNGIRVSSWDSN